MRNIYVLKFITRIISHKYEINQFPYMSCINANFIQLLFNHHRIIIKGNCSLSVIIFFFWSIVHLSIFKFDLYTDFSFRIVGFLYIRNYAISNNFACRISCHITRQLRVENGINHAGVFEFIYNYFTNSLACKLRQRGKPTAVLGYARSGNWHLVIKSLTACFPRLTIFVL